MSQPPTPPDQKIDINEASESYDICCSHSSVGFIKYIAMFSITLAILIFSMIQIATNPSDNNTIYFSLISSIMTLYIPSPIFGAPVKK